MGSYMKHLQKTLRDIEKDIARTEARLVTLKESHIYFQKHIEDTDTASLTHSPQIIAMSRAIQYFSTQGGLAAAIGSHGSYISQLSTGKQKIPAKWAIKIERITQGEVKRHELRPDLFQDILS